MVRLTKKSEYDGSWIVPLEPLAKEDGTVPDKDAVYQMLVDRLAVYEDRDDSNKMGFWTKVYDKGADPFMRRKYYCSHCGDWNTYGETPYCMWCGWPMSVEKKYEYN